MAYLGIFLCLFPYIFRNYFMSSISYCKLSHIFKWIKNENHCDLKRLNNLNQESWDRHRTSCGLVTPEPPPTSVPKEPTTRASETFTLRHTCPIPSSGVDSRLEAQTPGVKWLRLERARLPRGRSCLCCLPVIGLCVLLNSVGAPYPLTHALTPPAWWTQLDCLAHTCLVFNSACCTHTPALRRRVNPAKEGAVRWRERW